LRPQDSIKVLEACIDVARPGGNVSVGGVYGNPKITFPFKKLSLGHFDTAHEAVYNFNRANKCLFIFSIEGKIRVDGTDINERDAIGVWETGTVPINPESSLGTA
jgi:redox-sensitive bicupin YhaK (pirin superfamily)